MPFFRALAATLSALAAFLRHAYPAKVLRSISREIEGYEDEIFNLGISGSAADKLRIEVVSKRKQRANQQFESLRSFYSDFD
jgi:hypothetical protein